MSVTERVGLIGRVRRLAVRCAESYLASREELGFPLLAGGGEDEATGGRSDG